MDRTRSIKTRATPTRRDVVPAICLFIAAELELWLLAHTGRHSKPVSSVALAVMAVAVAIRRVAPLTAVTLGIGTVVVQEALHGAVTRDLTISMLFPAVIMYSAGSRLPTRRSVAALALAIALMLCDAVVGASFADFTFSVMLVALPWAFGLLLGDRERSAAALRRLADDLESERSARAATAVDHERARIARELHDVIAHSVSVMTLQVAGARRCLGPDPEKATAMVLAAEDTGREALAEIRWVLGVLRAYDDPDGLAPQPRIEQLDALIERHRRNRP